MNSHYIFPAIFEKNLDESVSIYFPDLPGVVTVGDNVYHGIQMAKEVLAFALYELEESGQEIPSPSQPDEIQKEALSDAVVYIHVWMPPCRDELNHKVVSKNCTLPKWLRDAGEDAGLNFSQILQTGVKEILGITHLGNTKKSG
jgi:predicted RNase H-like HicB family nuclease